MGADINEVFIFASYPYVLFSTVVAIILGSPILLKIRSRRIRSWWFLVGGLLLVLSDLIDNVFFLFIRLGVHNIVFGPQLVNEAWNWPIIGFLKIISALGSFIIMCSAILISQDAPFEYMNRLLLLGVGLLIVTYPMMFMLMSWIFLP